MLFIVFMYDGNQESSYICRQIVSYVIAHVFPEQVSNILGCKTYKTFSSEN